MLQSGKKSRNWQTGKKRGVNVPAVYGVAHLNLYDEVWPWFLLMQKVDGTLLGEVQDYEEFLVYDKRRKDEINKASKVGIHVGDSHSDNTICVLETKQICLIDFDTWSIMPSLALKLFYQ